MDVNGTSLKQFFLGIFSQVNGVVSGAIYFVTLYNNIHGSNNSFRKDVRPLFVKNCRLTPNWQVTNISKWFCSRKSNGTPKQVFKRTTIKYEFGWLPIWFISISFCHRHFVSQTQSSCAVAHGAMLATWFMRMVKRQVLNRRENSNPKIFEHGKPWRSSGWWFQTYFFICTLKPWGNDPILTCPYFFQMGWFNHQLDHGETNSLFWNPTSLGTPNLFLRCRVGCGPLTGCQWPPGLLPFLGSGIPNLNFIFHWHPGRGPHPNYR